MLRAARGRVRGTHASGTGAFSIPDSLKSSIDMILAGYGSFPLRSEELKVGVAVMDNVEPVMNLSQRACAER